MKQSTDELFHWVEDLAEEKNSSSPNLLLFLTLREDFDEVSSLILKVVVFAVEDVNSKHLSLAGLRMSNREDSSANLQSSKFKQQH